MPFSPLETLIGGYLLHLSTSTILSDTGRVFGISGIVDGAIWGDRQYWRWASMAGLVMGPSMVLLVGLRGNGLSGWEGLTLAKVVAAGFFVGFGSKAFKLGSGCTSGHFLCGVSRLSPRSILATATFFTTALITANTLPLPLPVAKDGPFHPLLPSYRYACLLLSLVPLVQIAHLRLNRYLLSKPTSRVARILPYLLASMTFSLGLMVSGMANPQKVLAFLQPFSPTFDPSLALIVVSGVLPNGIHWARRPKGKVSLPWESWRIPNRRDVDWRLVVGAAVFGIGWGLAGVCPGPALVGVGAVIREVCVSGGISDGGMGVLRYVGSMVVGMGVAGLVV